MSDPDLNSKIQNIERVLESLDSTVKTLDTRIGGLQEEGKTLKQLKTEVEGLRQIEHTKIEIEIQELTAKLEGLKANRSRERFNARAFFKSLPQHLLTYWTLLAFLITAMVAFYVYRQYGVGYFETYQNIANTKRSAKYYHSAGDVLVARAEFAAAEEAFKTATEIDPHDLAARKGLMLSQVLKSKEGRADPPQVIEARLEYLKAEPDFKDNPLLSYFQGRFAYLQGKSTEEVKGFFQSSVNQLVSFNQANPLKPNNFVGNYIELGILAMREGDISGAINYFTQPVLADINETTALTHLAECYIISDKFEAAFEVLAGLYNGSPRRLETYLVFGDLFRYRFATDPNKFKSDLEYAKTMDRLAERILSGVDPAGGVPSTKPVLTAGIDYGRMHFLPFPLTDTPKLGDSVADAEKPEQYSALTNYALSLDYALADDFTQADRYYSQALTIDTFKEYSCRFVYLTRFYRSKLPELSPGLKKWFDDKAEPLTEGGCMKLSSTHPEARSKKKMGRTGDVRSLS